MKTSNRTSNKRNNVGLKHIHVYNLYPPTVISGRDGAETGGAEATNDGGCGRPVQAKDGSD